MDVRSLQRQALEKVLTQLAPQYEAAILQSVNALDGAARVQADQQAEQILTRMTAVQRQIEELDITASEPANRPGEDRDPLAVHDLLRQRLHKIDYVEVEESVRNLMKSDGGRGRAGLLLFQRCGEMNGRLCAERILRILKAETDSGSFRHLPVEFRPADRSDPGALLRLLGGHLGLDGAEPPHGLSLDRVSAALCGSLQPGGIALLEIGRCDYLTLERPDALRWLANEFWPALLRELAQVADRSAGTVTVIALLFFDGAVPAGAQLPEHCCSPPAFQRERILEIELRPWQASEVEDWLTRWGGLGGHAAPDIRALARTIMAASGGSPAVIANQLLEQCATLQPCFAPA